LAGPGTGKTYQLAKRIKYLIEEAGAKPDEIAVITFTNEAARNMRNELAKKEIDLPKEKCPKIISTMHSLGNSIIGSNSKRLGLKEKYEVLYGKNPRVVLLKDAAHLAGYEREKWVLANNCRQKGECKEDISKDKCKICNEYKKILRKCSLIDYDDQILLACKILKKDNNLGNDWRKKTKYLLVDEYQDINQAQFELIKLLTEGQTEGLFVVGDDDQSIYSFRGGTPKYIKEFEKYYEKDVKIGRLSKSWRCPEHILKGAHGMVINFYKDSVPKPKQTFSEEILINDKIIFYNVPSEKKEAEMISAIVKKNIKKNNILIIIPNKNYLFPIKEALMTKNIDFKYNSNINEEGLSRILVLADWLEKPNSNWKLRYLIDLIVNNYNELTKKIETQNNGINFKREVASKLIANLWKEVDNNTSLYEIITLNAKINNNFYLFELKKCLENILEIIKKKGNKKEGIAPFLENIGLLVAPGKNPNGIISEIREWKNDLEKNSKSSSDNTVSIYNMPSSKGLQGDIVFVVGLSEELFPDRKKDIEEQSRLFYVAMTRAKKELYLFSARTRPAKYSYNKAYQLKKSPFITSISKEHIENRYIQKKKKNKGSRK
jgi:superfamily I DNA/RNA helicase